MTSWALRPASRARKAPALWMPSWELPASRITASLMFSGRRSARSGAGLAAGAAAPGDCDAAVADEEGEEAEDAGVSGSWIWVLDGVTVSPITIFSGRYTNLTGQSRK